MLIVGIVALAAAALALFMAKQVPIDKTAIPFVDRDELARKYRPRFFVAGVGLSIFGIVAIIVSVT